MNIQLPQSHHTVVARLRAEGRTTQEQVQRSIRQIRLLKLPYHVAMLAFFCGVGVLIGWIDRDLVALAGIVLIFLALGAYLKKVERLNDRRVPLIHYADSTYLESELKDTPALWGLFVEWQREARECPPLLPLLLDQERLLKARDEIRQS